MTATSQPKYWIASGGHIIGGPLPLSAIAPAWHAGTYPASSFICQDGEKQWMPLTSGVIDYLTAAPVVRESFAPSVSLPSTPVREPLARGPAFPGYPVTVIGWLLVICGLIGLVVSIATDPTVPLPETPTPNPNPPAPDRVANLHAMHHQTIGVLISLASILSGILILTRRK